MTKSSVRKAIVYSSGARYIITLISLVSTMLVSRLLTPAEVGTFAVASAIVIVMSEFRVLGASGYLVREEELTESKVRAALGLTLIISWGLGLLILASAVPVSIFYDLPPVAPIFAILSISFFVAPYMSIPHALLSRKMNFRAHFKVNLFASLSGFITTISLILAGASFYALAFGQTVNALVSFAMYTGMKPEGMVWVPRFRGIGEVASFGIFNSLTSVFKKLTVTIPDMIIGKMGTTAQVGMFSRSLGFIQFVSMTIFMGVKPVALPHLSEVRRSNGDLNKAYTLASVMLGGFAWPVLMVASVISLPAIRIFFGNQWDMAAGPASMLAYWAMLRTVHLFSSDLHITMGQEKVLALKEGILFFIYFSSIVIAFPYGLLAISGAFVTVGLLDFLVSTFMLAFYADLNIVTFLRAWSKNLVLTLFCWLVAWFIYNMSVSKFGEPFLGFMLVSFFMPFIWIFGVYYLSHPLKNEINIIYIYVRGRMSNRD